MGKHHWKIEKQPEWYVKAVRKTIAALPGGYAEAADWLDVTENALFNRLRADGDQIFPLGYADFLPERTWLPANQSGGGYHAGIPFSECSGEASSRTGEKRRHHDKAWRGPGHHASYRGEGRRQRGGRDYPRTACW